MRRKSQKVLATEFVVILIGMVLDFWLDLDLQLSNQLWNLASNPPPNGAFLFDFLAVFFGFHVHIVALWLAWGYQFYKTTE